MAEWVAGTVLGAAPIAGNGSHHRLQLRRSSVCGTVIVFVRMHGLVQESIFSVSLIMRMRGVLSGGKGGKGQAKAQGDGGRQFHGGVLKNDDADETNTSLGVTSSFTIPVPPGIQSVRWLYQRVPGRAMKHGFVPGNWPKSRRG